MMLTQKKNPAAVSLGRLGGKKGGKATTEAKKAASRANGKKGGAAMHKKNKEPEQ